MDTVAIRDLKPGMREINLTFIVLEVGPSQKTKDGREHRTCKVADHSGSVDVRMYDATSAYIQEGDICRLTRGCASSIWKGCLTLYVDRWGLIQKIGEYFMVFSETPYMSEPSAEYLQPQEASPDADVDLRPNSPRGATAFGGRKRRGRDGRYGSSSGITGPR